MFQPLICLNICLVETPQTLGKKGDFKVGSSNVMAIYPSHATFPEIAGLMKGSLSIIVPETSPNRALFSPFSPDHNSEARKHMGKDSFQGCQLWNFGYVLSVLNQFFMAEKHLAPGRSRQWVTGRIYGLIWVFPKIVVSPNHPILIGFSIINHPFWGTPIFRNTHMFPCSKVINTPGGEDCSLGAGVDPM